MISSRNARYHLNAAGEYVISNYNSTKLFSSFLPGVAGKSGIPMWTFYVNRGQCICSMGVRNKQQAIMEFLPANQAYQMVSSQGFRTFISLRDGSGSRYYEPFQNRLQDRDIKREQHMIISSCRLCLEEINHTLGLKFRVEYFNVTEDSYAGLVRRLSIQNIGDQPLAFDGMDGLPLITPFGVDNLVLKNMRRTIEAFVEVCNYETGVPFFRGKVEPDDRPDVVPISQGNFYLAFEEEDAGSQLIRPIVDPEKIFGFQSDLSYPERFLEENPQEMYHGQILENRLPCAMSLFTCELDPGESRNITSVIGHTLSQDDLNALVPRILEPGYTASLATRNRDLIAALTQQNFTNSREAGFDFYARQNFLDNTLRGGLPVTFAGKKTVSTLHLYSRKHGDLERDYNEFQVTPTPFSQGNGNFRDVNQNRRNDLFFNPDLGSANVRHFYKLIQLDGFNPLVILETRFTAPDDGTLEAVLAEHFPHDVVSRVMPLLRESFTPGELMLRLRKAGVEVEDQDALLGDLLAVCKALHSAEHGEGFWTDHWTYNLDLLENFQAVFPDQLKELLFVEKRFSFHDSPYRVLPRHEKHVIWEGRPMQLDPVVLDPEKARLIKQRLFRANDVHIHSGKGGDEVYLTNLLSIQLCLLVNKMASLDPSGMGVEMEAGKPGWYDALNGLPGLMGSSLCETLEVKRLILFLQDALAGLDPNTESFQVFEELHAFLRALWALLEKPLELHDYWDQSATLKEDYRQKTRLGITGKENSLGIDELQDFLRACLRKLELGISGAWSSDGVPLTYFRHEVIRYEAIQCTNRNGDTETKANASGLPCIRVTEFRLKSLPLFLEGPVHYLRCRPQREDARKLVGRIQQSELYDSKLKMFKVNASLAEEPMEIGRCRVFSPGWLENESIWLHMEYKYLLELLRNGLYVDFYTHHRNVLVPFLKPDVYGRSILENSSFLVSSANLDPTIHGSGYVSRLSGATAEFIHIMLLMTVGEQPFRIGPKGVLQAKFKPALNGDLFTREESRQHLMLDGRMQEVLFPARSFSFMFMGRILVTYHNPEMANTYGPDGVAPTSWTLHSQDGSSSRIESSVLEGERALELRNRQLCKVEIQLG